MAGLIGMDKTREYGKVETIDVDQIKAVVKKAAKGVKKSARKSASLKAIEKLLKSTDTQMGPKMKAEYLFSQAHPFPATVETVGKDRWARIALNSAGKKVTYGSGSEDKVKYVMLAAVALGVGGMVYKILSTMRDTSVMTTRTEGVSPKEIEDRQKTRGLLASLISALAFSLTINTAIDATGKVSSATSTALIGMVLGGTIGFLLDNALGSEEGFAKSSESIGRGARHAFHSMASGKYGRYIVTILFDMFFTVILFKPIFLKMIGLPFLSNPGFGMSLANGLTSTLISVVTFYCYTNLTRFQWAYPSKATGRDSWIKGNMIVLITAVMAAVYLISNTQLFPGEVGVNDPNTKLYIVLGCMGLLGVLMSQGVIDQRDDEEEDDGEDGEAQGEDGTDKAKKTDAKDRGGERHWLYGLGIFFAIVLVSIFGTYATSAWDTMLMKWGPAVGFSAATMLVATGSCFA